MDKSNINKKLYSGYNTSNLSQYEAKKILRIISYLKENNFVKIESILDVGCNPNITNLFSEKFKLRAVGINIFKDGMVGNSDWVVADVEKGLPFKKNEFDFVFCGEIIEHIMDIDFFISNLKKVLKPNGVLVITTPNLASFWNRFFLVFGFQPHLAGVSLKKSYGNPFLKWDHFCGHINLFTFKALSELLKDNGFSIEARWGEYIHNQFDSPLKKAIRKFFSLFPGLAEDMVFVCKYNGDIDEKS